MKISVSLLLCSVMEWFDYQQRTLDSDRGVISHLMSDFILSLLILWEPSFYITTKGITLKDKTKTDYFYFILHCVVHTPGYL